MGLKDFTFYDLINRNARIFADNAAWYEVDDGRSLTFEAYKTAVDRLAGGLLRAGVAKGDRLGVLGKNSLEYFLLYGAAAAVGAIVVAINWRLSAEEAAFNLNDCTPGWLFVDAEYQEMVDGLKAQLGSVTRYVNLKADAGGYLSFTQLAGGEALDAPVDVATDDGFVIIHTAAVAGRPRGALLSHGNVLSANIHFNYAFALTPADVHLNLLPLFHVGGLFMATNTFHAGALNLNLSKFEAGRSVDLIAARKVSLMFDFPPILASVLKSAEETQTDISSLRAVIGLGTPEDIAAYQARTGGSYFCMYGQTETSCLATLGRYDDRPGSAGKTIPLADLRLVDDADRPVPTGATGEIAVKGPMVFCGYWNLPEDTRHTFRNGWHHTGDMGRFDEDGFLWYAGRKPDKELIKPGGENVYPAEVEKAILQHPAVAQTVVFGVPDPRWKEGIKAVCRLEPGAALSAADLIAFVGRSIASYKKPQYVHFVDQLPQTADGAVDRAKVKELYGGKQG